MKAFKTSRQNSSILVWHLLYISGFILSAYYFRDYRNAPMSNL